MQSIKNVIVFFISVSHDKAMKHTIQGHAICITDTGTELRIAQEKNKDFQNVIATLNSEVRLKYKKM